MLTSTPLFMGGFPGGMELALIVLVVVLLFGANKIPKLARSTGQAMGEFQRGREEIEQELEDVREGPTTDSDDAETVESSSVDADSDSTESATESATDSDSTKN
ncbi:MAG: twin-arginine translocase TatA/TatE family subunit [Halarchaeum sp.]